LWALNLGGLEPPRLRFFLRSGMKMNKLLIVLTLFWNSFIAWAVFYPIVMIVWLSSQIDFSQPDTINPEALASLFMTTAYAQTWFMMATILIVNLLFYKPTRWLIEKFIKMCEDI
jgi:hypothetical protein